MKFSDSEFLIDKEYAEKLQNKKKIFREQTDTTKALFLTLVTTFGVKKNPHSIITVDHQITMNELF